MRQQKFTTLAKALKKEISQIIPEDGEKYLDTVKEENESRNIELYKNKVLDSIITQWQKECSFKMSSVSCYYMLEMDRICIPSKSKFNTGEDYYGSFLHEIGHATGNSKRLKRQLRCSSSTQLYKKEELLAQLSSLILMKACVKGPHKMDQQHRRNELLYVFHFAKEYYGSKEEFLKKYDTTFVPQVKKIVKEILTVSGLEDRIIFSNKNQTNKNKNKKQKKEGK